MRDIAALKETSNRTRLDFLNIDAEVGLTLAAIAWAADVDSDKRRRNAAAAKRAYDTILQLSRSVSMTADEASNLSIKLANLKSRLQQLGEMFGS